MKKFALLLIALLVGWIGYNISTIDFSDSLTSAPNQQVYMRLAANILVLISLSISYWLYSKRARA
jgi:hypothetical protein